MVFVNSMSDLFHVHVPDTFIEQVFDVMSQSPRHVFQVLTKRAERLARLAPRLPWPKNVWMGVTIESEAARWRLSYLSRVPAHIKFISAEPLLGPLKDINLEGVSWLIAGGESQAGARPANLDWFRGLRDQCIQQNVAFFLKQLGGHPDKRGKSKAVLDGRRWTQMPGASEEEMPLSVEVHDADLLPVVRSSPVLGREQRSVQGRILRVSNRVV
jgi:protein gp37